MRLSNHESLQNHINQFPGIQANRGLFFYREVYVLHGYPQALIDLFLFYDII
jgi:hypothetical protein